MDINCFLRIFGIIILVFSCNPIKEKNKPTFKFMSLNRLFTVSLSWEDVKQSQKGINYKMFPPCGVIFFHFFGVPPKQV